MENNEITKKANENKIKSKIPKIKLHKIIKYIAVAVILIVVFSSGAFFNSVINGQTKTTKLGFEDAGELVTQTAYMTIVRDTEEHREFFDLFQIPFTQSRQIFSYDIQIDASIDFSKITNTIDDDKKEIKIEMPHAKIYKATIDNDSLKVYLDKESLFSRIDLTEHNEAVKEMKEQGIEDAKANGILELAEKNAENLIGTFLKTNDKIKDYNITFEYKGE